jgi:hypothetical protein
LLGAAGPERNVNTLPQRGQVSDPLPETAAGEKT